jgi:hypothetical protein
MIHARLSQRPERGVADGGVLISAAVRARDHGEALFRAAPASTARPRYEARRSPSSLTGQETVSGRAKNPDLSGITRIAALLRRCARLISAEWLMSRWRGTPDETIIASHRSVEIRQTAAACIARTCVKGDAAQARATALRRLAKYTNGDNRGAVCLRVERPVIQQQLEPRRWRVSVRLSDVENARTAPAPLAPKVEVVAREPEMLAVVRMDGRPSHDMVSFGDAIILDAISDTEWVAIGPAIIRLHMPGPILRFIVGFEVAVPVSARNGNATTGIR